MFGLIKDYIRGMPKFFKGQRVWDTVHRQYVVLGEEHYLDGRWFYDVGTQTGAKKEDWISESCLQKEPHAQRDALREAIDAALLKQYAEYEQEIHRWQDATGCTLPSQVRAAKQQAVADALDRLWELFQPGDGVAVYDALQQAIAKVKEEIAK